MAQSMADKLAALHPQMLRRESEDDRKKFGVAKSVERALEIAGIDKQEAAYAMGYTDPGVVSRWCSGKERPHFDKLLELDGFEVAWFSARAEVQPRIKAKTVFEIDLVLKTA